MGPMLPIVWSWKLYRCTQIDLSEAEPYGQIQMN
jgi:hypothetical protein